MSILSFFSCKDYTIKNYTTIPKLTSSLTKVNKKVLFYLSDDLGEMLDIYINTVFDKVKLFRSDHVLGLIQGRLKGIRMAEGEVMICMDSYMEVQPGWYLYLPYSF